MDLVSRAQAFAEAAHRKKDQRRKYTGEPYEVHLQAVATLVASVTTDEETLAAAWLHDVVEDTDITLSDIAATFGPRVAELVENLTDIAQPSDGNRAQRKAIDREHLARACPAAKTVKLADILHNAPDLAAHDPGFARVYIREAQALLTVLQEGDARLYARAESTLKSLLAESEGVT